MKLLGVLMMGLLLVFSAAGSQDVRANEADEAYKTGLKYYNAKGVGRNYEKAMNWFRKAAEQGYAESEHNIGAMY